MTEDPSPRDDLAAAFAAQSPTRDKSGDTWSRSGGAASVEPPEPDEQLDAAVRAHAREQHEQEAPEPSAADDLAAAFRGGAS